MVVNCFCPFATGSSQLCLAAMNIGLLAIGHQRVCKSFSP
jgi:hypothetical protein